MKPKICCLDRKLARLHKKNMTRNMQQSSARQPQNSSSHPKRTQTHIWSSITAGRLHCRSRVNEPTFATSVLSLLRMWSIWALGDCFIRMPFVSCGLAALPEQKCSYRAHGVESFSRPDNHTPTQNKKLQNNMEHKLQSATLLQLI